MDMLSLFHPLLRAAWPAVVEAVAPDIAAGLVLSEAQTLDSSHLVRACGGFCLGEGVFARVPGRDGETRLLWVQPVASHANLGVLAARLWQGFMRLYLSEGVSLLPILLLRRGDEPGAGWVEHQEFPLVHESARLRLWRVGFSGVRARDWLAKPSPVAGALAVLAQSQAGAVWLRLQCLQKIARAELAPELRALLVDFVLSAQRLRREDEERFLLLASREPYREVHEMITSYFCQLREEAFVEGQFAGEARGEAKGRAAALLELLAVRKLSVSRSQRLRILACVDIETLRLWSRYALTATSVQELLGESPQESQNQRPASLQGSKGRRKRVKLIVKKEPLRVNMSL
jgi:hypothetical protein